MKFRYLIATLITVSLPQAALPDSRILDAQRVLNSLGIDAGPNDGAWGRRTEEAVKTFMEFRGLAWDGEFDENEYAEITGLRNYPLPDAEGMRFEACHPQLPSHDSFAVDPEGTGDRSHMIFRAHPNDYDPANYNGRNFRHDIFSVASNPNLNKQRSEICRDDRLRRNRTYTMDFDIRVGHPSVGSVFQLHAGGPQGAASITAFPDSLRFNAGRDLNNLAIWRGDVIGEWLSVRLVTHIAAADDVWFRFYVNGEETLDTRGRLSDFGFSRNGANLKIGIYRGKSRQEGVLEYRNFTLTEGDGGAPAE